MIRAVGWMAATVCVFSAAVPIPSQPVDASVPRAAPAARSTVRPDEVRVIGISRRGREIVAERYGSGPVVLFVGGAIHGNEKSGISVINAIADPRPAYTTWIIRRMNPDGHDRATRGNAAGIDLNRNFSVGWRSLPCPARNCSGPAAASEPETVALEAFFTDIQPKLAVFYHSTNNGIDDSRNTSAVPAAIEAYSARSRVPIRNFRCKGPCSGTVTRFITATVPGSTAFVVELPREDPPLPRDLVTLHTAGFWAAAREVRKATPTPPG